MCVNKKIVVCLTFNREMRRGNSGGGRISKMRDLETLSDRMEGSGKREGEERMEGRGERKALSHFKTAPAARETGNFRWV